VLAASRWRNRSSASAVGIVADVGCTDVITGVAFFPSPVGRSGGTYLKIAYPQAKSRNRTARKSNALASEFVLRGPGNPGGRGNGSCGPLESS
jgi:hypothetical protein